MRVLFRVSLLLTAAFYLALVAWSLPMIQAAAGDLAPFDLRPFGYSADEARAFLVTLSDAGRAQYLGAQRLLDLAYPGLLALTLVLGIFRFGARLGVVWRVLLSILPLAGAAFDYAENTVVAAMLQLPVAEVTDAMIAQASLFTVAKSALTGLSVGMVLILAVQFAIARRRRMKRRAARLSAK